MWVGIRSCPTHLSLKFQVRRLGDVNKLNVRKFGRLFTVLGTMRQYTQIAYGDPCSYNSAFLFPCRQNIINGGLWPSVLQVVTNISEEHDASSSGYPEDHNLKFQCCENLESHVINGVYIPVHRLDTHMYF
jgi:hypothetical protein